MKKVNQQETDDNGADEINLDVDSKDEVMRDGRNDPWFWEMSGLSDQINSDINSSCRTIIIP